MRPASRIDRLGLAAFLLLAGSGALERRASADDEPPVDGVWMDRRFTPAEIAADGELKELKRRVAKGELPDVRFELDSEEIAPESYKFLQTVADLMLKTPSIKLRIDAHTCSLGSEAHNLRLSRRRAQAVKNYLVQQGVPPPSIHSKGWGSARPIADNSTEEGRRRNRRVEFRFLRRDWNAVF